MSIQTATAHEASIGFSVYTVAAAVLAEFQARRQAPDRLELSELSERQLRDIGMQPGHTGVLNSSILGSAALDRLQRRR
jgi:hypothetical protein